MSKANIETENMKEISFEVPSQSMGPSVVRRLLNVIPIDIQALLKELDEEV